MTAIRGRQLRGSSERNGELKRRSNVVMSKGYHLNDRHCSIPPEQYFPYGYGPPICNDIALACD